MNSNKPLVTEIEFSSERRRWEYQVHKSVSEYDKQVLDAALQLTWTLVNRNRFTVLDLADQLEKIYASSVDKITEIIRVLRKLGGNYETTN